VEQGVSIYGYEAYEVKTKKGKVTLSLTSPDLFFKKKCDEVFVHLHVHAATITPETQKRTRRDGADKGRHNDKTTTAGPHKPRPKQNEP
jgi:hypothetical protein